ncbi:MAG: tyrosine-type recombinase/integrase [Terracidiphilus sp.]
MNIREIARRARVSHSTVLQVINQVESVDPKLARRRSQDRRYSRHCIRPAFAGRLVMAGVDLRTVAELLGHGPLQMVMRYAHLAPEHQVSAVDRPVPADGRMATQSATGKFAAKKPKQTQTLTH